MFLGDSLTFGWGVEATATFPCVVSLRLGFEAENWGVAGYGTDQEWLTFRREIEGRSVEAIVVTYSPNDLHEVLSGWRYGRPKPMVREQHGRLTVSPARDRAIWLDGRSALLLSLRYRIERRRKRPLLSNEEEQARELVWSLLSDLATRTRASGGVFFLVVESQVWLEEKVAAEGLDGLRLVDVGPALSAASAEGPVRIPGDGHWNERGHAAVTERLAAELSMLDD